MSATKVCVPQYMYVSAGTLTRVGVMLPTDQQLAGQQRCVCVGRVLNFFQVDELNQKESEAWTGANEVLFPLPGNGIKEEASLRWGGGTGAFKLAGVSPSL